MGFPGKPGVIERLVDDHYAPLYRYAYRLSGSAADAEDLTQETFCQAQLKLSQLRDPSAARSWLFTILRNAYLHRTRGESQRRFVSLECVGDVPEPSPDPLPEVDPQTLQRALNDLAEVYRTPLILYYFEEFSYRDIARQMDLPIGTVMSRLARAKAFLRSRLFPPAAESLGGRSRRAPDGL